MRKRIFSIVLVIFVVTLIFSGCQKPQMEKKLQGHWKLTTEDLEGEIYIGEKDFFVRAEDSVDTTYTIAEKNDESRTITILVVDPDGGKNLTWKITFSEDFKRMDIDAEHEGLLTFEYIDNKVKP